MRILILSVLVVSLLGVVLITNAFAQTSTVLSLDSKYEIYMHVIVRNPQGELISVAETSTCRFGGICSTYFPHEITDYAFDTLLGKKEIVIIDNIKYEKVQFSNTSEQTLTTTTYDNQYLFDMSDREPTGRWEVQVCGEPIKKYGYECVNIFYSRTSVVYLELGDVVTAYWTILREMN